VPSERFRDETLAAATCARYSLRTIKKESVTWTPAVRVSLIQTIRPGRSDCCLHPETLPRGHVEDEIRDELFTGILNKPQKTTEVATQALVLMLHGRLILLFYLIKDSLTILCSPQP